MNQTSRIEEQIDTYDIFDAYEDAEYVRDTLTNIKTKIIAYPPNKNDKFVILIYTQQGEYVGKF